LVRQVAQCGAEGGGTRETGPSGTAVECYHKGQATQERAHRVGYTAGQN